MKFIQEWVIPDLFASPRQAKAWHDSWHTVPLVFHFARLLYCRHFLLIAVPK